MFSERAFLCKRRYTMGLTCAVRMLFSDNGESHGQSLLVNHVNLSFIIVPLIVSLMYKHFSISINIGGSRALV